MIDWESPEVLAVCGKEFAMLSISVTTGFTWYLWKSRHDVEVGLITDRLQPKYSHIPYIIGRYSFLASSTMFAIVSNYKSSLPIDCQPYVILMSALLNISTVTSSANMLSRPLVMWNYNPYLICVIILCTMGHLALALEVPLIGIEAVWDPRDRVCYEPPHLLRGPTSELVFYAYTVTWDSVILLLTCVGLHRQWDAWNTPLGALLRKQGIIYISITCAANITAMVFAWVNLNEVMDMIFALPGGAISVILSSQLVASFRDPDEEGSIHKKRDPEPITTDLGTGLTGLTELTGSRLSTILELEQTDCLDSSEVVDGRLNAIDLSISRPSGLPVETGMFARARA